MFGYLIVLKVLVFSDEIVKNTGVKTGQLIGIFNIYSTQKLCHWGHFATSASLVSQAVFLDKIHCQNNVYDTFKTHKLFQRLFNCFCYYKISQACIFFSSEFTCVHLGGFIHSFSCALIHQILNTSYLCQTYSQRPGESKIDKIWYLFCKASSLVPKTVLQITNHHVI